MTTEAVHRLDGYMEYNCLYSQAPCFNPNGSHQAIVHELDFAYQQSEMKYSITKYYLYTRVSKS
jgi:hypothetical protein